MLFGGSHVSYAPEVTAARRVKSKTFIFLTIKVTDTV